MVSAPSWWQSRELSITLVAVRDHVDRNFAAIYCHGVTVPDLLPADLPPGRQRVDAFNSGGIVAPDEPIEAGSIFFVQPAGIPPPVLSLVSAILSNPALDCHDGDLPVPPDIPDMRYLLLGAGFEQRILDLDYGPVSPQVARATGSTAPHVSVWFQKGPVPAFGRISVEGTAVTKCLAYRPSTLQDGGPHHLVFIDARTLGKPICCRLFSQCVFRAEDFLEALDLQMSPRFTVRFSGPEADPVGGDPLVRKVKHCSSVTLQVALVEPGSPLTSDGWDSDECPDDADEDEARLGGPASSRSSGPAGAIAPRRSRSRSPPRREHSDKRTHSFVSLDETSLLPAVLARPHPSDRRLPNCTLSRPACRLAGPPSLPFDTCPVSPVSPTVGFLNVATKEGFLELCGRACQLLCCNHAPRSAPISISLSDSLPWPTAAPPCKLGSLSLGFSVADIRALVLSRAEACPFRDFLHACDAKTRAWFLQQGPIVGAAEPGRALIYTDGSFLPATPDCEARMGWAVAVFEDGPGEEPLTCRGVLCGPVPAIFLADGQQPSAFVAECAALVFAGLFSVSNFPARSTVFVGDCQPALACASGSCSTLGGGIQAFVRNAHLFRSASSPGSLTYEHVRSHEGHFGNEVVDTAARFAAAGRPLGTHPWADLGFWGSAGGVRLAWASLVCRSLQGDSTLPCFDGRYLGHDADLAGLDAASIVGPFLPASESPVEQSAVAGQLCLRVVTVNVLTLNAFGTACTPAARFGGLGRQIAKPALLAASLLESQVNVAAVQESRCERGSIHTMGFLRFCSGALSGQYGTELWFRIGHRIFSSDRGYCDFQDNCFVLLHDDPRRILIRYRCGCLSLTFASVHAPHRAVEAHLLDEWWAETARLCGQHSRGSSLILAGDFNASVGSLVSQHISDHALEQEDLAGTLVHDLARLHDLWLPSTFGESHWGDSWTYKHKHGDKTTRIDYVLIPLAWRAGVVNTWTDSSIHAGQSIVDHQAAVLDLRLPSVVSGCRRVRQQRRPRLDERHDPANHHVVADVLRRMPDVPWHVSAHAHASLLVKFLQDELGACFPRRRAGPCHAFLGEDALRLRQQLSSARHRYARLRAHVRSQLLWLAFDSWRKRDGGVSFCTGSRSRWSCRAHFAAALYGWHVGSLAAMLRKACASDKAKYLSGLAERVASGDSACAFASVRRLLGHKRKKPFAMDVLPTLKRLDGTLCDSPCSVASRWREHFSALEGGLDATADSLLHMALCSEQEDWPMPACLNAVPTIQALASTLKSAPAGKAPGPDGLPNGIGISCPSEFAEKLYPIALKMCVRGSEPLGFKSGLLCKMFKGRGPHDQCTSFRGILLLPTPAKAIHKCLRPALADHFERTAVEGQLSGRKGMSVAFATHALRGFFRSRLAIGESVAVLYADVSAAYYRAVRELSSRPPGSVDLEAVCKGLNLSSEDLSALSAHLAEGSALELEAADPWLQRITAEINSKTWMCIAGDSAGPILTTRGTRPGSSWADLVFGLLVKRLIARRDELLPENHQPLLTWDGDRSFAAPQLTADSSTLRFGDLIWADDLATPLVSSTPHDLPARVATAAGTLSDAFAEHAMELSYGPLKTAAIVALRGPGSRAVRRQIFGRGDGGAVCSLPVLRESAAPIRLPLVDSYKHLGSIQSYDGSLLREIKQRVGQAWGAFREGRRQVYKNKLIPPDRRCAMLTSLVVSRLTRLEASSPSSLLHAARLRYAAQMVRRGPPQLWAITKCDRPYCDLMFESFCWLYGKVGSTCGLPDPASVWAPWADLMLSQPGRYKGWIKRALALDKVADKCASEHAELHKHCRARSTTSGVVEEANGGDQPIEMCLICRRSFLSRLSWASHAARVHQYRAPGTRLAVGSTCKGCGKQYANVGRLRRHLSHSLCCREDWGRFAPASATSSAHPQMPPTICEGVFDPGFRAPAGSDGCSGLALALRELVSVSEEQLLQIISECIAPISDLRSCVQDWRDALPFGTDIWHVADNTLRILSPRFLCVEASVSPSAPTLDPAEFPILGSVAPFAFSAHGTLQMFRVADPPYRFCTWPWQFAGPLKSARKQAAWASSALSTCSAALAASASGPVAIDMGTVAAAAVPSAVAWLVQGGFAWVEGLLQSPVSLEFTARGASC